MKKCPIEFLKLKRGWISLFQKLTHTWPFQMTPIIQLYLISVKNATFLTPGYTVRYHLVFFFINHNLLRKKLYRVRILSQGKYILGDTKVLKIFLYLPRIVSISWTTTSNVLLLPSWHYYVITNWLSVFCNHQEWILLMANSAK